VLLFREWERLERAENARLIHDFQLLGHSLIVPCATVGLWREAGDGDDGCRASGSERRAEFAAVRLPNRQAQA
jgi:hypothetical protein